MKGSLSPEAKAFLFMCRVGMLRPPRSARWLRYTENERPVNWFAGVGQDVLKRAWAGVGRGLLRVLSNFFRVAWCVK